jgi:hypothetical protein
LQLAQKWTKLQHGKGKKGDDEREKKETNKKGNEARNYADRKKDTQRDCTN